MTMKSSKYCKKKKIVLKTDRVMNDVRNVRQQTANTRLRRNGFGDDDIWLNVIAFIIVIE